MSIGIPDLWPDEVAFADVVSPLTILRHQAGQLRAKTKGLLEGEIVRHSCAHCENQRFWCRD